MTIISSIEAIDIFAVGTGVGTPRARNQEVTGKPRERRAVERENEAFRDKERCNQSKFDKRRTD